jgi:general nucleoside transport system permease protein
MIASMAICGAFAGIAGAIQVLGVNYAIASSDVPVLDIGFTGIAVALLGRNTGIGVVFAALLFAALQSGGRQLSGSFSPELASGVSGIIQGTIILLVGGELIVRWLVARAKRERAAAQDVNPNAPPPQVPPAAGVTAL